MLNEIATKSINTIRTLSIDAIQKANSGHPGLPMGAAPMAYVLWKNHLKIDPKNSLWDNRDRFILSAGHGSMLLYSLLHLSGFDLSMDDIKNFRQWGSKTPGHPEFGMTDGVETTTGPLGQGIGYGVGMAIAEKMLAARFNKPGYEIFDHYTFVLTGDGCLMEGISAEAASLAGHLKLGKLIYLYDSNDISLDGPTDLTFTEDVAKKYESYGFQVLTVGNGDTDINAIDKAIAEAKKELSKPTLIIIKTTIGFGSPNKSGKADSHGAPLGKDEVALVKKGFGVDPEKHFFVEDDIYADFASIAKRGEKARTEWEAMFEKYCMEYPELGTLYKKMKNLEIPVPAEEFLPVFEPNSKIATRSANGKILGALAQNVPWLIGGDADLSCSTKTAIGKEKWLTTDDFSGRNIHFGVREHAMGSIANGISYYGFFKPFTATFFSFVDYMRPALRLASLSKLDTLFVFTHDSLAVGEDGPTHQPVEQLASIRCIPGLTVIRPADANETSVAWKYILENRNTPTALVLTRQDVPVIERTAYADSKEALKGGYAIKDCENPDLILIATGSEVHIALEAAETLEKMGKKVKIINMFSFEIFEKQSKEYREKVLPPNFKKRIVIEAGTGFGWHKYATDEGIIISVDRFGESAPGNIVLQKFGFSAENIVETALKN
ncbi:MAG: transketolase [bacterium]